MKTCRECKAKFEPRRPLQVVCSPSCALKLSKKKSLKAWDAETRKRKLKIKKRSKWLSEAQTVFNAYVRERDKNQPCISCNNKQIKKRNAGHFLSVGAHPELRFNLWNVHLQCEHCNSFLAGNISNYLPNLIERIGPEKVEWLNGPHEPKKYSIEDIKRIKTIFTIKLKRLKNAGK